MFEKPAPELQDIKSWINSKPLKLEDVLRFYGFRVVTSRKVKIKEEN